MNPMHVREGPSVLQLIQPAILEILRTAHGPRPPRALVANVVIKLREGLRIGSSAINPIIPCETGNEMDPTPDVEIQRCRAKQAGILVNTRCPLHRLNDIQTHRGRVVLGLAIFI